MTMKTHRQVLSAAEQHIVSPEHVVTQAQQHQRDSFGLWERNGHTTAGVVLASGFFGFMIYPLIMVIIFGKQDGLLGEFLFGSWIAAFTVVPLILFYVVNKFLIRLTQPKYLAYQNEHPVDATIAIVSSIQHSGNQARLETTLSYAGQEHEIESIELDMAQEESLKTVAQCQVRNNNCEQLLNSWVTNDSPTLPSADASLQLEEGDRVQQQAEHYLLIAQQMIENKAQSLPTAETPLAIDVGETTHQVG